MTTDVSLHIQRLLYLALTLFALQPAVAAAAPPSNDDLADAAAISMPDRAVSYLPSELAGTNTDATLEAGEPVPGGVDSGHSVWYRLLTDTATAVRIHTCSSNFHAVLGVYTGDSLGGLTAAGTPPDQTCGHGGVIDLVMAAGTTYRIVVRGEGVEVGTFKLSVGLPDPPVPPRQPTAAPACPAPVSPAGAVGYRGTHAGGGDVCLTVLADFSGVASFQMTDVRFGGSPCFYAYDAVSFTPPLYIGNRRFATLQDRLSGQFGLDRTVAGSFQLYSSYFEFIPCTTGVVRWTATTTATPPWVTAPAATTRPLLRLSGATAQHPLRRARIVVRARCPQEACRARATLLVGGVRLRSAEASLRAGVPRTLTLRLSRAARRTLGSALRSRRFMKRTITVVARDAAGNRTTAKRTVTLRR